jgi:hypothetical protein
MTEVKRKMIDKALVGQTFSLREFEFGTVNSAIEFFSRLRDGYPGKILVLQIVQEPYSDYEYYQVYERRQETDEEARAREARESAVRQDREKWERAEYERLKKQFGE